MKTQSASALTGIFTESQIPVNAIVFFLALMATNRYSNPFVALVAHLQSDYSTEIHNRFSF